MRTKRVLHLLEILVSFTRWPFKMSFSLGGICPKQSTLPKMS